MFLLTLGKHHLRPPVIRKVAPLLICLLFLLCCKKETTEPVDADGTNGIRVRASLFQACLSCQNQVIQFRGIRPDDSTGKEPLLNPERGLRLEHIMKVHDLANPYHPVNFFDLSSNLEKDELYYSEKTKLTQVYFYLTSYMGISIPEQAFRNMQLVLDNLKKSGYKAILIFAYRYDDTCPYETYADIKKHLGQLKPFLQKNESLIFAVQAGFLGLWGEWHSTGLDNSPYHKKVVIRDILQAIPASRKMQVRETAYKTDAAGFIRRTATGPIEYFPLNTEEYNRIGFQNAYLVLDQGPYAKWDYRWPDEDYFLVKKEALATVVDGEMPYNGQDPYDFNELAYGNRGGWKAIQRMKEHVYSSFSVVHNYRLNINAWKRQAISRDHFHNEKMAVGEDYFLDRQGQPVTRSAYEYIRDHLGYRFQLKEASIPMQINRGDSAVFSIELKNFGFAPLINKRPVYLVLIDEQNNVSEILTSADPRNWLPAQSETDAGYTINQAAFVNTGFKPGTYKVGLWLPDDGAELRYNTDYAIRFANGNMEYWKDPAERYLVNIIGNCRIN